MKKICFVDYDMSVMGGVEQVTAALANALCDKYEIWLISMCMTSDLKYKLDKRIHFISFFKHDPGLKKLLICTLRRMCLFLSKNQIDVVIAQGNYPGFLLAPIRFFLKTKLVFCDHGALMNQWNNPKIVTIRKIASKLCHMTVTLTEQSRNDYIKQFKLPDSKVDYIYNWIDLKKTRSAYYNKSTKRIVSAGRFGKEKGFDMLVKAFIPVANAYPDWSLDIFGDGEMMETVQTLVKDLGMENNISLLGMRNDLYERYCDYAMYVLPSYREGMPLVLLEAKANRLPIISFDIMTGPREIIRSNIDGILVPPYDIEQMSKAIITLINDEVKRFEMSERSQENLDKFSKETILNKWIDLIENI